MKWLVGLLRIFVPLIVLWILFQMNVWLGLAVLAGTAVWLFIKYRTVYYGFRGNMSYQKGQLEDAVRWLHKAAARKDVKPSVLIGFGFLLLKHGELDQAEELLKRAGGMRLDREELLGLESNTALLLWRKGQLAEAIAKLEALKEEYKNTNLYGTLGYFYILTGDLDKALAFNQEAHAFNESGAVILDNLGQTYYLRGELEQALKVYEELSAQSPNFPEAYYNYGLVLEALGRREEALEKIKQSLDYPLSFLSTVTREEIEGKIRELEQRTS